MWSSFPSTAPATPAAYSSTATTSTLPYIVASPPVAPPPITPSKPTPPPRPQRRRAVSMSGLSSLSPYLSSKPDPMPSTPIILSSTSLTQLPAKSSANAHQRLAAKRADTKMTGSTPSTPPLRIATKKASRPSTAGATIGVRPLILSASATEAAFDPEHPGKTYRRCSVFPSPSSVPRSRFSKSSGSASPATSRDSAATRFMAEESITAHKRFCEGIGLDLGSPETDVPPVPQRASIAPKKPSKAKRRSSSASKGSSATSSPHSIAGNVGEAEVKDEVGARSSLSSKGTSLNDEDEPRTPPASSLKSPKDILKEFDEMAEARRSLFTPIPMTLSRSHQEMIASTPIDLKQEEAAGIFDSVRGLMADLGHDMHSSVADESADGEVPPSQISSPSGNTTVKDPVDDQDELRKWLSDPRRPETTSKASSPDQATASQYDSTPSICVARASSPGEASKEHTHDVNVQTPRLGPQSSSKSMIQDNVERTDAEEQQRDQQQSKGLWGLLRAPSTDKLVSSAPSSRPTSISSYCSNSSFLPQAQSSAMTSTGSRSSLSGSLSFFGRMLKPSGSSPDTSTSDLEDDVRIRLPRRQIDEDKIADQVFSCAEAKHLLMTDASSTKLKEVGLKLEQGWREQLAEAQELRSRLDLTQDTVGDLEDENKHLRAQLGTLSEQIANREDEIRLLEEATSRKIEQEKAAAEAEAQAMRKAAELDAARVKTLLVEEKAVSLGLGMMMLKSSNSQSRPSSAQSAHSTTSGLRSPTITNKGSATSLGSPIGYLAVPPSPLRSGFSSARSSRSVTFQLPGEIEVVSNSFEQPLSSPLRRAALLQGRDNPEAGSVVESFFQCPTHRIAQGSIADPCTIVDENVLLVGDDIDLLRKIATRIQSLGDTSVIVAYANTHLGASSELNLGGVRIIVFNPIQPASVAHTFEAARSALGGEVDCIVNAFHRMEDSGLSQLPGLMWSEMEMLSSMVGKRAGVQAASMVTIVYEDDGTDPYLSMQQAGLMGLCNSLARQSSGQAGPGIRRIRLNTVLNRTTNASMSQHLVDGILRLLDPCSSIHGSVCRLSPSSELAAPSIQCVGPPTCLGHKLAAGASGGANSNISAGSALSGWDKLVLQKRAFDGELLDAVQDENSALSAKLKLMEDEIGSLRRQLAGITA